MAGDVMSRPRLLDLFCGAGGASMGYHRAGFDVVGVDRDSHPDYPFEFIQADALEVAADLSFMRSFGVRAASPPCQARTTMSNRYRGKGGPTDDHPRLIGPVRELLLAAGGPYVIENVVGARDEMRDPILLHGGMFGLQVHRPRLFESNVFLLGFGAPAPKNPIGVYGRHHDGRRLWTRADGTSQYCARTLAEGQAAMGIDWMAWNDLTEAIPPAYTEFLGGQLFDVLAARTAVTA